MSFSAPGLTLVVVFLLSILAPAAPYVRAFEGAGAPGGTAFAGPLSGLLPTAGRGVCARCPAFTGAKALFSVEGVVSSHVHGAFSHRARMTLGREARASSPGLSVLAGKASSATLDKKVKAIVGVATVNATGQAPRLRPGRRRRTGGAPIACVLQSSSGGRGIGESIYVSTPVSTEYKPASWQLDAEGAKDLLAAKKAQASGAKQSHTPGPVELPGLPPTLVVDSAEVESSESSEEDVLEKEWTAETKQAAATRPQVHPDPRIPRPEDPTPKTRSLTPAIHPKPEIQSPKPEDRSPEPES